ncbi:MAG TPA: hypothetical protein VJN93_04290 [Candidatus Acidoferrum sp.]|nr:hypothetical protein [Candidatus Acidoferrum sp.]
MRREKLKEGYVGWKQVATIGRKIKIGEWRALGDDFRTFLSDFLADLTQESFSMGCGLRMLEV